MEKDKLAEAVVVDVLIKKYFPEIKTLYIKPGSPWENGHIESFHDKLCDECLNRELFDTDGIATPISNKLPYASTRFAGTSATIGLNDTIRNTVVQKEKYLSNPRCAFFDKMLVKESNALGLKSSWMARRSCSLFRSLKRKDIAELS